MPVLGHGFVGLATALVTGRDHHRPVVRGLWLPAFVALAYLPDIAAQIGMLAGAHDAGVITHSVVFAVGASLAVALGFVWCAAVPFPRGFVLALFSILLHLLMDVLQGTNRALGWPFSLHPIRIDQPLLPPSARGEASLFAVLFCLFIVLRFAWRRVHKRGLSSPGRAAIASDGARRTTRFVRLGVALTALIFVAAGGTHVLRSIRTKQLEDAWARLSHRDYAGAFERFAQAERWPGAGKPGRIDYARAEAYAAAGDRTRAEQYYLASLQADPDYFWAVADLAVLYASSGESADARRARAEPYLQRLRTDFADHPRRLQVMERIERKLRAP